MRVVSWNLRRNAKAIDYAFDVLNADILLAQECNQMNHPGLFTTGRFIDERWVKHKWGNISFSKNPVEEIEIDSGYLGSMHLFSVLSPIGKLALGNLYGLFEKVAPESRNKMVTSGLHRKLSDLSPLLWARVPHDFEAFMLMGDLNLDRRMDEHPNFRKKNQNPVAGVMKRFEDFQLEDLLLRDYPEYVQTYRPVRGNFPWQLDHAFASRKVSHRLKTIVISGPAVDSLSDHNPIVVDIN